MFIAVYALRTSDAHQPLRMPGQEAEEFTVGNANGATGRFYNGFRWYRPLFGRYTQADLIDYNGGQYNLYSYTGNNPLNAADPLGLTSIGYGIGEVGGALIGGAIGGVGGAAAGAAGGTLVLPGVGTVAGAASSVSIF